MAAVLGSALAIGHGRGWRLISTADGSIIEDETTASVVKDLTWQMDGTLFAVMPSKQTEPDGSTWNVVRWDDSGSQRFLMGNGGYRRLAPLGEEYLIMTGYSYGPLSWDLKRGVFGPDVKQVSGVPGDLEAAAGARSVAWVGEQGVWQLDVDSLVPRQISSDDGYHAVAAAQDSAQLFVSDADQISCVRAEDGSACWPAPVQPPALSVELAVSPNGQFLAAGLASGQTLVLSTADGTPRAVLGGHDAKIAALAFNADSTLLATGSWDGTVRIWSTGPLQSAPLPEHAAAD